MLQSLIAQIGPPESCGIEFAGGCDPANTFFYVGWAVIAAIIGLIVYRKMAGKKLAAKKT